MEVSYTTNTLFYRFKKPPNWHKLLLYRKIRYYGLFLTKAYAPFVDKIHSKYIVKQICGDLIEIPKIIRILKDTNDIYDIDIQDDNILKPAHGCGEIIDFKEIQNIDLIKERLIKNNTLYKNHIFEKQYSYLTPRFFIEEKIHCKYTGNTSHAYTFKIRCFYGEPKLITVKVPGGFACYDILWNPIEKNNTNIEKPEELDSMLHIAKLLSKPFEFVRIDLYIGADGKLYFSEYTFTPSGGNMFYSNENEIKYSNLWK